VAASIAIEDRGPHATGFGWTDDQGWPYFWRSPGRARDVAPGLPLPANRQVLIGHTRWATHGDPEDNANNHPQAAPGLVLVHNGVVSNHADLHALLGVEPETAVDTEAVANLLSHGPDLLGASAPDLLELLEGSFALAWLDAGDPGALHLARGPGRPMALAHTRRGDLVMASTPKALQTLARASRVGLTKVRSLPAGSYLRVEEGRITHVRTFRVPKEVLVSARPKAKPLYDPVPGSWRTPRRGDLRAVNPALRLGEW